MSEYQYVAFRAVDRPVSEADLDYMRQQSSRAKITPWSFENTYQYGDFRGNTRQMLQRGYDVHLHYASYGIRKLMIRLPTGLPDPEASQPYFEGDTLHFQQDDKGPGGILTIQPFNEPGDFDPLYDAGSLFERLVPLRSEILAGDLRPLCLGHLVMALDGEHSPELIMEGPVPAGLTELTDAQQALAEYYGIDDDLLAAAARESPPLPKHMSQLQAYKDWLVQQPVKVKDTWLAAWMTDPHAAARGEILLAFRGDATPTVWPTSPPRRTVQELQSISEAIFEEHEALAAAQAAKQRAVHLRKIAKNPEKVFKQAEELVAQRKRVTYRQAAALLTELKEAIASTNKPNLAEDYARKLIAAHPTLRSLRSELRKQGLP